MARSRSARTLSIRITDEALLDHVERRTADAAVSEYIRRLVREDMEAGRLTGEHLIRHLAATSEYRRIMRHVTLRGPSGPVEASPLNHQIQMMRAMDMHDRLMLVHCRGAGVTTAFAVHAIAAALRGDTVLYVAHRDRGATAFTETCAKIAASMRVDADAVNAHTVALSGGRILSTANAPDGVRSTSVDRVLIDTAEYTLPSGHYGGEEAYRAIAPCVVPRGSIVLACNGCVDDWMNEIADECAVLRYPLGEVVPALGASRVEDIRERMSEQQFESEYRAIVKDGRE